MKNYYFKLFFLILLFSPFTVNAQNFCAILDEVLQNEAKLDKFKGKEKEKLWIGSNYESSIEIPGAVSTHLSMTATTAIVATVYDDTDLKAAEAKFQSFLKKMETCLADYKKSEQTKTTSDNVTTTREIIFVRKSLNTQTVVLQYWKQLPAANTKKGDKKAKARILLIFPQNGFYI
ncbi:MAG: hypothetical protein K1X92_17305 [Bacteroidia bacterium]|nr:hypothetical protein [Bacteroidia bacterium]